MTTVIGFKIPLEVDERTGLILDGQSKIANWLYNCLLEQANELKAKLITSDGQDKEAARTLYTKWGLYNLVPQLKQDHPFLKSVYSSFLKNAALRLSRAIRECRKSQEGKRSGPSIEWPHFRSWKRKWFSLEYDEPWQGYALDGNILTLSLGVDRDGRQLQAQMNLAGHFPYAPHQVKSLQIVKNRGRFYVVFMVNKSLPTSPDKLLETVTPNQNHKYSAYDAGADKQNIEIKNTLNSKLIREKVTRT